MTSKNPSTKRLPHEKHEIFAHAVAFGNPPALVYYALGYDSGAEAAEYLLEIPSIKKRINHLRQQYKDNG